MKPNLNCICFIPWVSSSIRASGIMRLCCTNTEVIEYKKENGEEYNAKVDGIDDSRNCSFLCYVRKSMMDGIKLKICETCWNQERRGVVSKRVLFMKRYPLVLQNILKFTKKDGSIPIDKFPIIFYDLRLSNLCNCKCLICNKNSSSKWGPLQDWSSGEDNKYIKDFKKKISDTREIYFTGGEPFIIEKHWELIKYIIDSGKSKNIRLKYNSNGRVLNEKMVRYFSNFKVTNISFSLDAIGDQLNVLRPPTQWKEVKNNIMLYDKIAPNHCIFSIAITISIFNLLFVPSLLRWVFDQKFKRLTHVNISIAQDPKKYSIVGQKNLYKEVEKIYSPFFNIKEYQLDERCKLIVDAVKGKYGE
jgi:hypothetical protein